MPGLPVLVALQTLNWQYLLRPASHPEFLPYQGDFESRIEGYESRIEGQLELERRLWLEHQLG